MESSHRQESESLQVFCCGCGINEPNGVVLKTIGTMKGQRKLIKYKQSKLLAICNHKYTCIITLTNKSISYKHDKEPYQQRSVCYSEPLLEHMEAHSC